MLCRLRRAVAGLAALGSGAWAMAWPDRSKADAPTTVVRTVTTGVTLKPGDIAQWASQLRLARAVNDRVQSDLESRGFEVQTTRLTTNPFEEYADMSSPCAALASIRALLALAELEGLRPVGLGPATSAAAVRLVPDIVKLSDRLSMSIPVPLDADGVPDAERALEAADACIRISRETPGGLGNFQLAVSFNARPNIPFFPVGYHRGPVSFAIGCENSPEVVRGMQAAGGRPGRVKAGIRDSLEPDLMAIQECAEAAARDMGVRYDGVDASVAPTPTRAKLTDGYESLGLGGFGAAGSLFTSSLITGAVRSLRGDIKTCGYTGLMLPPLEDPGLAAFAGQTYGIRDLLLYSAVCGVGLDTVPIPGDTDRARIAAVYLDAAALAFKLNKPLTARLFPVPDKEAGELTEFDSPYMCNGRIFAVP